MVQEERTRKSAMATRPKGTPHSSYWHLKEGISSAMQHCPRNDPDVLFIRVPLVLAFPREVILLVPTFIQWDEQADRRRPIVSPLLRSYNGQKEGQTLLCTVG